MSLQVEKLENNMAKLTIEVPADDLEKALQSAYMKQKNKIAMPGFRKGKVPRQMIEKMYGPEIFYDDAANALIPKAYSEAYEECELEIVSRPEINVVQIEKGKSFIFTADVATKPEVKLGEYKGLEVDKVSTRVTQKEVDAKIQEEAEKNAREVVVTDRAVADGDEVILDFEGFVDGEAFEGGKGENYPLTIGSGSFIPGFEDQLVRAEAEKEVEVKVTFPEDYHAEELKGKEAVFKCTVHEIKAKELPEIDDEFAAEESQFDTLEEKKEGDTFTVGFDQDFPPMGFVGDDGEYTGFDLELAKEVCDRNGWEFNPEPIAWDSKDALLKSGEIDCIWNGFTMNGREDEYTWSEPYLDNQQVFVVRADSGINSEKDLAGKTVDVQTDSSAEAALKDNTELSSTFSTEIIPDYNTGFMNLESGAVDAVAMDIVVAKYQIESRSAEFKILDYEIASEQYGVGFAKGNDAVKDQVQKTLNDIPSDGTLAKISTKWFGEDITTIGK